MSLFNVRTWWSEQCNDVGENYDKSSLLCTRFGLDVHEKDYIIVGSHNGLLSIFYPKADLQDYNNVRPTDLLLECQLESPILGLVAGRFSGPLRNENANLLAVLHLNSLVIYNLVTVDGVTEQGNFSQLHTVTEHSLTRAAFSLCKGHFGQVKERDFVCVSHLDGSLTFFEQDGISYECHLSGPRSLPAMVVYVDRTDSFLRVNSSWLLESFRTSTSIMILGERNFIVVNDYGKLDFLLKLDYSPRCFHTFLVGYYWESDSRLITAIASENSKIFIYDGKVLIWAAQLDYIPTAVQRSNLNHLPGAIVILSPCGLVNVYYLGSEPHVFQAPPFNAEEINFEQARLELLQLEKEIKQAIDFDDMDIINQMAASDLRLEFNVGNQLNECQFEVPEDLSGIPMCDGYLKFETTVFLEEIQITIRTPGGVRCTLETLTYNYVESGTGEVLSMNFYLAENLHIESAIVEVIASFINKQGIPRVLTKSDYLPLSMFFQSVSPQKSAATKVTFSIYSKSFELKLSTFFPEFRAVDNDGQAVGLKLIQSSNDDVVTVVIAKNSNRIRVQCSNLEALPLILERIIVSVAENQERQGESDGAEDNLQDGLNIKKPLRKAIIANSNGIPTKEILKRVHDLHSVHEEIRKQTALMDALWNQFKLFQRSLQIKSEGEPTNGLLMLIERNYDDLVTEGDKLVELRAIEKSRRSHLSCALAVAKMIISCLKLERKLSKLIMSVLSTPAEDWAEQNWEHSMAPAIEMLHYYGPLSRSKTSNPDTIQNHFEYDRFYRHFGMLFERVINLASLTKDRKSSGTEDDESEFSNTTQKSDDTKSGRQSRLEILEDEEEESDIILDEDESGKRPESDWLNSEKIGEDFLSEMLNKKIVEKDTDEASETS